MSREKRDLLDLRDRGASRSGRLAPGSPFFLLYRSSRSSWILTQQKTKNQHLTIFLRAVLHHGNGKCFGVNGMTEHTVSTPL